MKVQLSIWDKLSRLVIGLLFIAGLLSLAVWYLPRIKQNKRMRHQIMRLDTQVEKEEEIGRHLRSSIDNLRNDPQTLERLARERLGYARPGETVIRFESPATNSVSWR